MTDQEIAKLMGWEDVCACNQATLTRIRDVITVARDKERIECAALADTFGVSDPTDVIHSAYNRGWKACAMRIKAAIQLR